MVSKYRTLWGNFILFIFLMKFKNEDNLNVFFKTLETYEIKEFEIVFQKLLYFFISKNNRLV